MNRAALVTGAGSGIGLATARELGAMGYRVALLGRDSAKLATAEADIEGSIAVECDVAERRAVGVAVARAVDEFGGLDVVVANAGTFSSRATLDQTTEEEWRAVLATNLDGVFFTLAAALPHLRRRHGYAFVVGSLYSRYALRLGAAYTASKWGALGLSHTLVQEFEEHGVRSTAVLPGVVATAMVDLPADDLLEARDVARTVRWCLELSRNALVREVLLERVAVARNDAEIQEDAPAWHRNR